MKKQLGQENIPKYMIIYEWLIKKIEAGEIRLGEQIPTENDIMQKFSVNRSTIRAAMSKLERAHMISRQRGKGTFLISTQSPKFVRSLQTFSTIQDDLHSGTSIEWRVLSDREDIANIEIASKLHIPLSAPIHSLVRVGYTNEEPFVFESVKSTTFLIEELKNMDMTKTYYPLLGSKENTKPAKLTFTLKTIMPDFSIKELLALDDNQPCIEVETTLYNANNTPLDITKAVYRGDKYIFNGESKISF